ncbi:MAG TPA: DUF2007 domain-containing protein [Thermoanaerobaculia bacterium]|nr:DUF2007 domain-containing protein [Thermoanaerobaculia bacterium]
MKRVYVAGTPVDAQFVKAFLESAGIEASVRGEHLFALRGSVPMTDETLPSVWIEDEDDLEYAQRLLAQLEARARLRPVDAEAAEDGAAGEEWDEGEERIG